MQDLATPTPRADEVRVKVHAASINSWDWEFCSGTSGLNRLAYGLRRPKTGKRTLGADIAGVVDSVGREVTRFHGGEEVYGDLWDRWGGFAEYACTNQHELELKPRNLTFEQAAAVPQAGVLALQGLCDVGCARSGQRILINGAGGGVGTFAVQIAKHLGTHVTAVDALHKLAAVEALGADRVVDFTTEQFERTGAHYDIILDVQASRSIGDCKRTLEPGGVYVIVGGRTVRLLEALLRRSTEAFTRDGRKVRFVAAGPNKGLTRLTALLEQGAITPVVDRVFDLARVADAMRYFAEGRHTGKVVITTQA